MSTRIPEPPITSSVPLSRGYYSGQQFQFPQYLFAEPHQKSESTDSQDSVRTQVPARFYQRQDHVTYPDQYASHGQAGVPAPFATPNLSDATNPSSHGPGEADRASLNPKAPAFGVAQPYGILSPMYSSSTPGLLWSGYLSEPSSFQVFPASAHQAGIGYNMYGGEKGNSSHHFQGAYGERNPPDPFRYCGVGPSMSPYGSMYPISQTCCSSGLIASPVHSLAPVGNNCQGVSYSNYPLVAYGQGINMNALPTNFVYDTYRAAAPGNFSQAPNPISRVKNMKPTHYGYKHRHKSSRSFCHGLSGEGHIPAPIKNREIVTHMEENSLVSRNYEEDVQAPQLEFSRDLDLPTPIGSSESFNYAGPNEKLRKFDSGPRYEEIEQTPLASQKISQKEFFSEQRVAAPPKLRSRRGQSISSAIPTCDSNIKSIHPLKSTQRGLGRASPPKMDLSLFASGCVDVKALSPFNQNDPFSVRNISSSLASASDPFSLMQNRNPPNRSGGGIHHSLYQSSALNTLVDMGNRKPSVDEVLDSLPFIEYCRLAKEDQFGVIKIKNIPYSVNRPEVMAFLGSTARIVSEQDHEPIHIVMERVTSKTLDCYVEFVSFDEALHAVDRFDQNRSGGRNGRLGHRYVEVEISNQESLMQDLFPKANNVEWAGAVPKIKPRDPDDKFNSGFQGFISKEELIMLVKHVEAPQRSSFAKESPQRPFECIISTLFKYPWYMVEQITIEDRDILHKATMRLLSLLKDRLESDPENIHLNPNLYKRVWNAAMKCQGFSPSQKDDIAVMVDLSWEQAQEFGLPPFAASWKRLWTIGARPDAPNDLILWYIAQIREATDNTKLLSLAERSANSDRQSDPELFGLLHKHIDYGDRATFPNCTLAQVAKAEWAGIEKILRQIFTPSHS